MTIKFIELFAGIGGFRYGLENVNRKEDRGSQEDSQGASTSGQRLESEAGKEISSEKRWGDEYPDNRDNTRAFTCVYSNDFDKNANAIYRCNYGKTKTEQDTRDIRQVRADEIPDHDLLTAGFPCQSFSIAGQRGGLEDTRGTLFFEVARILREKRPKHFIIENVKGMLSHDKGRTFNTIIGVLTDLGYRCEWELVDSKYFGLPQRRERVFIVGHLREECEGRVFPLRRTIAEGSRKDRLDTNVVVLHNIYGGFKEDKVRIFDSLPTLRTPAGGGHVPSLLIGNEILFMIRKVTPLEYERGQGFEDYWTQLGYYGDDILQEMSDTSRYKAIGNAVSPPVITVIGEKLLDICDKI